jgi:hypothetical protein
MNLQFQLLPRRDTFCFHYTDQSMNAVRGNNRCYCDSHVQRVHAMEIKYILSLGFKVLNYTYNNIHSSATDKIGRCSYVVFDRYKMDKMQYRDAQ